MAGEALIIDGVRTPRGRGKPTGALHEIHPQELLAQVLTALAGRTGIEPGEVEDVVMGNGSHAGDHANDIARMAVLAAGWPIEVPGVTLNRFCGSGQQAVMFAAMGIAAGWQHLVVAGGVESMSRFGRVLGAPLDGGNPRLRERYPLVPQGISADLVATLEGFGRPDVDAFAVRSQDRAAKAIAADRFARSLVPVHRPGGDLALDHDEHPRPGTSLESLAGLPPRSPGPDRKSVSRKACPSTRCAPGRTRRRRRSATSTTPGTPPGWSTARPPCCSARRITPGRTGSRRGPRWWRAPSPGPSRSSC